MWNFDVKYMLSEIKNKIWYDQIDWKFVDWYSRETWDSVSIKEDLTIEEIILDEDFIKKLVDFIYNNNKISKNFKPWKDWIMETLWYKLLSDKDNFIHFVYWQLYNY